MNVLYCLLKVSVLFCVLILFVIILIIDTSPCRVVFVSYSELISLTLDGRTAAVATPSVSLPE